MRFIRAYQESTEPLLRAVGYIARLAFKANPSALIIVAITRIITSVIPLLTAFIAGAIITQLSNAIQTKDPSPVIILFAIGFGLQMIDTVANTISQYFNGKLRLDIENTANELLMQKYARLSLPQREDKEIADIFERAEEFTATSDWVFDRGITIIANLISFVGALIAISTLMPLLGLIVAVVLLPAFVIELRAGRIERRQWKKNSTERRKANGYRFHLVTNNLLSELRLQGLSEYFVSNWRQLITKDRFNRITLEKRFMPARLLAATMETGVGAGALIWAALQIISGKLPIGSFVTLQSLINNVQRSGRALLWMLESIDKDLLNTNDFYSFLQLEEDQPSNQMIETDHPPLIEFDNVTFTYPIANEPTLKNVTFTIQPGEAIALVGENGSGKTTIVKLLLGFYQPEKGEIRVNGVPLAKLDPVSWYKQIGVLFQDFSRFDFTTLGNNIWFGDITKKKEKQALQDALEQAQIGNLSSSLEFGFDQILSKNFDKKNGTDLSGGQWQRVALSRSFFRKANILILDEPTAAVDAKAEYEIFKRIAEVQKEKTTIIISHRFSTVRKAKTIYVIENGCIVEQGSHQELMKQAGSYAHMFELQAEGYK